jgi:beta-lactamase superfamily II metal-dependent hydrolase
MRKNLLTLLITAILLGSFIEALAFTPSGLLEIHYINVGWGTSVLVIGPDGTRILMDGGRDNMGASKVIPYMRSLGLLPTDSLTYIIASHQHSDHIAGLTEVMNGGYDVSTAIYYNGSNYNNSYTSAFFNAASRTSAGPAHPMAVGQIIQLGDSATMTCVCANGYVIGSGLIPGAQADENDRSIGLLIKYGRFEYIYAGDLGGGDEDNSCTHRSTSQVNVEGPMAAAIMPGGVNPLLTSDGVEVLHVNHHGSESSTSANYMNLLTPAVACIATGSGQSPDYMFPRYDVVNNVLLSNVYCVTADPALVLQNEEGQPAGSLTSYAGYCVGDFVISTSGVANYTLSADGLVTEGPDERAGAGLPRTIPFDGVPPDLNPPTVTLTTPNGGEQWIGGSLREIEWNDFDSVGVASYALDYSTDDGSNWQSIMAQTFGDPDHYQWSLPLTPATACRVKVTVWDAAGNSANDISNGVFSIVAGHDTISPSVTVLWPNGGELLISGFVDTIRWQASDNIGIATYAVSYTINGGSTWNTILPRTFGSALSYPWTVPNIVASNCKVKITVWDDLQNQAIDSSDATFRIHFQDHQGPIVDIITPDGGEVWTVGSERSIFWSATDESGIDSVAIQYSSNAGINWYNIRPYTHDNSGFYSWIVPDIRSRATQIRVQCKDVFGNMGQGISATVFTIRKTPVRENSVRTSPIIR